VHATNHESSAIAASRGHGDIERWFAAQGPPPRLDLARSGASPLRISDVLAAASTSAETLADLSLDYGSGLGDDRLRDAVASSGSARTAAEVLITHGAVEALRLICAGSAPGRVVVGTPAYGALVSAPAAAGRMVTGVPVWDPQRGIHIDGLLAAVLPGVALVIVNSPHNPSGGRIPLPELERLGAACQRAGATLVVDEVARATLDREAPSAITTSCFASGSMAVIGDVSKSLGLGGLRVGWLTTADAGALTAAAAAKDDMTISNSVVSQRVAALALENAAILIDRVGAAARSNRDLLGACLGAIGGEWITPADGLVGFPALVASGSTDAIVGELRRREVAVVPGSLFGAPERLRIGLGADPQVMAEALDIMATAVAAAR
jgi:aspartate/methionine/tyrosine aminotransferase